MTTIELVTGEKIITETNKLDVWGMCIGSEFIGIDEKITKCIAIPDESNPHGKHVTEYRDVFIAVNKIVKIY